MTPRRSLFITAILLLSFRLLFFHPWHISLPLLGLATILALIPHNAATRHELSLLRLILWIPLLCLWSQAFIPSATFPDGIVRARVTVTGFWWRSTYDWRAHVRGENGESATLVLNTKEDPSRHWRTGQILDLAGEVDTPPPAPFRTWRHRPYPYIRVKSTQLITPSGKAWWTPLSLPMHWNSALALKLKSLAKRYPLASSFSHALILGRIWEVDEDYLRLFKHSGLMHILAISGLHVGIMAFLLFLILLPFRPHPALTSVIFILLFSLFMIFTGFRPSVVRASLFLILYFASRLARRPMRIETIFWTTFILSALFMPQTILTPGSIFTFTATGLLLLLLDGAETFRRRTAVIALLPLYLLPLQGWAFRSVTILTSLLTPFLSLLLIPLLPLAGLATISGSSLFLYPLERMLHLLVLFLETTLSTLWWGARIPSSHPLYVFAIMAGIILLLSKRRFVLRPLALILLYLCTLRLFTTPGPGFLGINVGEGLAMAFKGCTSSILIDTGPYASRMNLIATLLDNGITRLNGIILTHPDSDHVGAFDALAAEIPIGRLFIADSATWRWKPIRESARRHNIPVVPISKGMGIRNGPWHFTILWPPARYQPPTSNEGSLVLIAHSRLTVLVTGDAPASVEEELLPVMKKIDILQVGHHGSRFSTSRALLQSIHPRIAFIPSGRRNPYHHPAGSVLADLKRARAVIFRSDKEGNLYVRRSSKGIIFSSWAFRSLTSW